MKKLGYIFLCMVALWGCQDNADYRSKGKMPSIFSCRQTIIIGRKLWIAWFTLLPVKG